MANSYLTLASDRELERLARQTLQSQEDSFERQQLRYRTGAVSGLDLAQSKTTVEQARADHARFDGDTAQDIDTLTLLVGTSIDPALLPEQFDSTPWSSTRCPPAYPLPCCYAALMCSKPSARCEPPTPI